MLDSRSQQRVERVKRLIVSRGFPLEGTRSYRPMSPRCDMPNAIDNERKAVSAASRPRTCGSGCVCRAALQSRQRPADGPVLRDVWVSRTMERTRSIRA